MKTKSKLVSVLALLCILCIAAAGCGGSDGGDGSSSAGDGDAKLSGTVEVWDPYYESLPEYTEAIKQLDSEFEKQNPGVTVKREAQPLETYEALIRSAFASREGPDMMVMEPAALGVLSFTKGLEVLNDRITPEMEEQLTQWNTVTAGYTTEGEHYGVPQGINGYAFYYNKQLFKKAGLPTKFEPKTWAEVMEAGEKLKAAGIQPFTGGNEEGYENQFWFSTGFHSVATPEETKELAEGTLDYTDPVVAKAYEPSFEMEEAGLFPSDRFTTSLFNEGYARFADGEGAMVLGLWNAVGYWGEFNPKLGEENVGFFLTPESDSVETVSSFGLTIPTLAKNKDAAWALIEFETSKRGIEVLDDPGGFMPNRKDVSLPPDAPIQARELLNASRENEEVVAPSYMVPPSVAFGPMNTEVSEAMQGRISLAEAQQAMQETAEKTAP